MKNRKIIVTAVALSFSLGILSGCVSGTHSPAVKSPGKGLTEPGKPPGQYTFEIYLQENGECRLSEQWIKHTKGAIGVLSEGDLLRKKITLSKKSCDPLFAYGAKMATKVDFAALGPSVIHVLETPFDIPARTYNTCMVGLHLIRPQPEDHPTEYVFNYERGRKTFSVSGTSRSSVIPSDAQEQTGFVELFRQQTDIDMDRLCVAK